MPAGNASRRNLKRRHRQMIPQAITGRWQLGLTQLPAASDAAEYVLQHSTWILSGIAIAAWNLVQGAAPRCSTATQFALVSALDRPRGIWGRPDSLPNVAVASLLAGSGVAGLEGLATPEFRGSRWFLSVFGFDVDQQATFHGFSRFLYYGSLLSACLAPFVFMGWVLVLAFGIETTQCCWAGYTPSPRSRLNSERPCPSTHRHRLSRVARSRSTGHLRATVETGRGRWSTPEGLPPPLVGGSEDGEQSLADWLKGEGTNRNARSGVN